ncbi:unnamed protein product, partial [Brassica oleracea]
GLLGSHRYLGQYKVGGCESSEEKGKAAAEASEEAAAEASEEEIKYLSERVEAVEKKVGITTKRKGTSSQNTTSPPKPTLEPGVMKVLMGRMLEGRAWRRIKVQMCPQLCPQMLVPRKIKLQNRALFYWTKINPLFRIYRRRMLDIRKRGMLLWHFAVQINKEKLKELADWLKTDP